MFTGGHLWHLFYCECCLVGAAVPFVASTKILMCSTRRFVNVLYGPQARFSLIVVTWLLTIPLLLPLPTTSIYPTACMHLFLLLQTTAAVYRVFRCQILVKCKKSSIVCPRSPSTPLWRILCLLLYGYLDRQSSSSSSRLGFGFFSLAHRIHWSIRVVHWLAARWAWVGWCRRLSHSVCLWGVQLMCDGVKITIHNLLPVGKPS